MKRNTQNIIIGAGISLAVLGGVIWLNRAGAPNSEKIQASSSASLNPGAGSLKANESSFNFGQISMGKGPVSHQFKIKNSAGGPVQVRKIYTSCMCTTASLITSGGKAGPFGMPGHGFVSPVNRSVGAGEEAIIEVVFDPAAHGPAGVGPIDRAVYLETSEGVMQLGIKAVVEP